ncbi:MAG: hypothetical protein ACRD5L_12200, partial [Bryobacteraceae bacterium]
MPQSIANTKGFAELSRALARLQNEGRLVAIRSGKIEAIDAFQPLFTSQSVDGLSKDDFIDFLKPSKNKHWSGLSRKGLEATKDMPRLR